MLFVQGGPGSHAKSKAPRYAFAYQGIADFAPSRCPKCLEAFRPAGWMLAKAGYACDAVVFGLGMIDIQLVTVTLCLLQFGANFSAGFANFCGRAVDAKVVAVAGVGGAW